MARVTGPLHSDDASGRFAGSMVFAAWKGIKYVRSLVKPSNPKSAGQKGIRAMMKFAAQIWATIGAPAQASWDAIALARNISAFNAFVSEALVRWQSNLGLTYNYPATESLTTLNIDSVNTEGVILAASGAAGYATLSATPDSIDAIDTIAVAIYRSSAAPTKTWNLCIAIIPVTPGLEWNYTDSPLLAGTYHYKQAALSIDGLIGPLSAAEVTAVVT